MVQKSKSSPVREIKYRGLSFGGANGGLDTDIYYEYVSPLTESISYEPGPKYHTVNINGIKRKIPFLKNCVHDVTKTITRPWSSYATTYGSPSVGFRWPAFETSAHYTDTYPSPDPLPISTYIGASIREMYPKLKGESNLLNFIYELRELKTLIPSTKNIAAAIAAVQSSITQFLSLGSKVFSESVLNLNFGILPLIADIEALSSSLKLFKLKLYEFRKRAGTIQRRNYKQSIIVDSQTAGPKKFPGGEEYTVVQDNILCNFTATLYYTYSIENLPSLKEMPDLSKSVEYKTFLKYMGLRTGALPEAFWNALPFSFLIDYVVKIGNWLGQLDLGALDITLTPVQYCYSIKRVDSYTHNMLINDPNASSSGSQRGFCYKTVKRYSRTRVDDLSVLSMYLDPLPEVNSLDAREQWLVVNLINGLRK